MLRTHRAGELREEHIGTTVTLTGWIGRRRDHGGVTFLDLRDASGVAQVVVREDEAMHLRNEYVLRVTGTVDRRPEGNENPQLATGTIEVTASEVEVLNTAAALPLPGLASQRPGRRDPPALRPQPRRARTAPRRGLH